MALQDRYDQAIMHICCSHKRHCFGGNYHELQGQKLFFSLIRFIVSVQKDDSYTFLFCSSNIPLKTSMLTSVMSPIELSHLMQVAAIVRAPVDCSASSSLQQPL